MAHRMKLLQVSPTVVYTPSPHPPSTDGDSWSHLIFALVVTICVVLTIYVVYCWFGRDLIILFRARRQRSTEEIGFGNTPVNPRAGPGVQVVGGAIPG
uniref:Movement protein n=1 Tax=Sugarcane white streak virus TaxID=1492296 RepID=A0A023SGG2_9GEMI|nr:movement protein [Sugarcane white streak virus]